MAVNPRGFVPSRHLTGGQTSSTRLYLKDAQAAIHIGDAVCLVSGAITTWVTAQVNNYIGVVAACYDSNKKPLTHQQPSQGPCLTSGQAGYVDVYDDPDIVFIANCSATAAQTDVGTLIDPVHVSGHSSTGISRHGLARAGTSAATFRIVGLAPNELGEAFAVNQDLEVVAVSHVFRRGLNNGSN